MCGILGIVGLDKNKSFSAINAMLKAIKHRGPDADGIFISNNIALGHARLSIIDLSDSANQPLHCNFGRYTIIFNGEIYNYRELRERHKDYKFISNSDTEVILAYYITYGKECLSYLNGFFSFAIWDNFEEELFIARDRMGVKPLYYCQIDNVLLFASEIRSMLASNLVSNRLNYQSISDILIYGSVIEPDTILDEILMLGPGKYAIYKNDNLIISSYWDIFPRRFIDPSTPYQLITKEVKSLFYNAVERRLVSDVDIGCFLSGGIDSSLIVGVMSELSSKKIDTFSMIFEDAKFSEESNIDLVTKRFNTRSHKLEFTTEFITDRFFDVLNSIDTPSIDGFNTYFISRFAKEKGISVALSGIGADELFCGYSSFSKAKFLRNNVSRVPNFIRNILLNFVSDNKRYRLNKIFSSDAAMEVIYAEIRKLMSPENLVEYVEYSDYCDAYGQSIFSQNIGVPALAQYSILELKNYTLNTLIKDADQYSMSNSLEIREPFLDYSLVEYVLSLPDNFKNRNHPKSLLLDSVPILPKEILNQKKRGFVLPWSQLIKTELRPVFIQSFEYLENFQKFKTDNIINQFNNFCKDGKAKNYHEFYSLMVLSNWMKKNIPC